MKKIFKIVLIVAIVLLGISGFINLTQNLILKAHLKNISTTFSIYDIELSEEYLNGYVEEWSNNNFSAFEELTRPEKRDFFEFMTPVEAYINGSKFMDEGGQSILENVKNNLYNKHFSKGKLYFEGKEYKEAIAEFEKALIYKASKELDDIILLTNKKSMTEKYNWSESELEIALSLHNKYNWSYEKIDEIMNHRIKLGMNESMVIKSIGVPDKINKDTYSFGVKEQWVYRNSRYNYDYVYFKDGIVSSFSEKY